VAREYFWDSINIDVSNAVETALSMLSTSVAGMQEVQVPVDEDRTVAASESWTFHQQWLPNQSHLYDPRTLARIRSGQSYTPEQIGTKREELAAMRSSVESIFRDVDAILTPTLPILPPTFAELDSNPEALRPRELLMLRNTRPWNVLGIPAISVPCGEMIGLQIAALEESTVLEIATEYERLRNS
jgi:Asp-tRNA(Asn)/Glu-tRNA(Gln) amidotransferase A subunit family amidase